MQINCPLWNHCLPILRCIQRIQTDLSGLTFFSWAMLWLAWSKLNTAKWPQLSKPPLWLGPWISCTTPPWTTAPLLPRKPPASQDPGLLWPTLFHFALALFVRQAPPAEVSQGQILFHSKPREKSVRQLPVGGSWWAAAGYVLLTLLPSLPFEQSSKGTFSLPIRTRNTWNTPSCGCPDTIPSFTFNWW